MTTIYVAGIAMTVFGRHVERSLHDLAGEALQGALKDAGCQAGDIGVAYYSGMTNGPLQGQISIPGQVVFSKIGIEGIPVYNVENACASGSSGVQSRCAEPQSRHDRRRAGARRREDERPRQGEGLRASSRRLGRLARRGELPDAGPDGRGHNAAAGLGIGQTVQQVHGDLCGDVPLAHEDLGTTQRQIAAVCAKNHQHSVHNPLSQFRKPFTIDEVLAAPPITYPITLPMCAPLSDGAAAAILCTEEGLKRIGADRSRCIKVAASVIRSFTHRGLDEPEKQHRPPRRAAGL